MPDLGQVIGTLLTSLAHARRMADEETAAIAEYYRSNPLLQGMSLPRIRVPELTIDLPMLIESHEEGEPSVPQDSKVVHEAIMNELVLAAERENLQLTEGFKKAFEREIKAHLESLSSKATAEGSHLRESTVRAVDTALARTVSREKTKRFSRDQHQSIATALRQKASEVALKKAGIPSVIKASVVTSEVKEFSAAGNVVRLKLVLREEGLEWSVSDNPDGTTTRKLAPE
jgi:hypothetical protein